MNRGAHAAPPVPIPWMPARTTRAGVNRAVYDARRTTTSAPDRRAKPAGKRLRRVAAKSVHNGWEMIAPTNDQQFLVVVGFFVALLLVPVAMYLIPRLRDERQI